MLKNLIVTYFKGNGGLAFYQALMAGRKNKSKGSKIGFGILFAWLMVFYVWMIAGSFFSTVVMSPQLFFAQAIMIAFMLGIMFSYTSVESILIKANDLTFLSPLPIKKSTLNFSRFIILYIEVAFESLLVYIPFFVVSAIKVKFSILWYLLSLLCMVMLPVLSAGLMGVLSYLGARFRLIRRINIFLIYAISFSAMLFLVKNSMSEQAITDIIDNYGGRRDVTQYLGWAGLLTGIVILLSVAFVALALFLAPLREHHKEGDKKGKKEKIGEHGVRRALIERELSIVRSNNTFFSELLMEQLIPVVLLVIYSIMGIAGELLSVLELEEVAQYKGFLILGIMGFFYAMSMVSSTSVSREGKDFYILKVYPITVKDRVESKIEFHMIFTLVFALPIILASLILMKVDMPFILCGLVLFTSLVFVDATVGLWRDFSDPKLDWKLPTVAVKQNTNGLFAMLFMLPVLIVSGIIAYFGVRLGLYSWLVALIISVLLFACGFGFKALTMRKAKQIL